MDRPDLLGWRFFPDEVVAAAAVVAASLPGGEGVRQLLADQGYDADAILLPAADPEARSSDRNPLTGRDSSVTMMVIGAIR